MFKFQYSITVTSNAMYEKILGSIVLFSEVVRKFNGICYFLRLIKIRNSPALVCFIQLISQTKIHESIQQFFVRKIQVAERFRERGKVFPNLRAAVRIRKC